LSAVFFGGPALLDAERRLSRQTVVFGRFLSRQNALGRFFIKQLGSGRRAALCTQALHHHGPLDSALAQSNRIAGLHLA
jgi:hypothetical protein